MNIRPVFRAVTEAIPDFGADFQTSTKRLRETDYPAFFRTSIAALANGKISITFGSKPVYIEEKKLDPLGTVLIYLLKHQTDKLEPSPFFRFSLQRRR